MVAEMNKINIGATRNLGVKLLKNSLKTNAFKAMNKIVNSSSLSEKIIKLNEQKAGLLSASVQHVLLENQKLLASNDQLNADLSEAINVAQTKERFFNIMAHDLKNPIGAIPNLCELVSDIDNMNDIKELVGTISKTAAGSYNLLNGLNELRRASSGKLMPAEFNLHNTVNSIYETIQGGVDLNKVSLVNSISPDMKIVADPRIVEIVIRNLVSNAIKFTDAGSVKVSATSVNGNPVQISVKDTGAGIRKATLDKLLVKGDFVTTISSRGNTGTGFGIPLCKDFVRLLGGELLADSEEGKGTTFKFTVPKNPHLEYQK